MHTKKHVLYASYFCGVCLYIGIWTLPAPIAIKIVWTGGITFMGAMLLNVISDMGK